MSRKPRQLPAQNTLPYLLLTLTALCGEYPIRQISHLPGGSAYLENVVTALRRDGLLRTFSKDGLRGLRLTSSAKRLLLADAPEWFSAYLTGSSEPNKLKSEIPRRLRLHRMAEILTIMHNADIPAFPWEKTPFSAASQSAAIPAYYTSREIKEIGPQGTKIRSSRATGILLTDGGIFLTYNTAKAQMKWEYKAELRFKALLQTEGVMPDAEISGIVFGSTMEQLSILTQPDAHSYFLLDGSFPHFYYLTNDRYGEAILRLLCDTQQRRTLDAILADGLHEGIPNWRVANDAIDSEGNPVLFAYARLLETVCDEWELGGFHRAIYEYQAEKLRQIADKFQCGIGYDYDAAVRKCQKLREKKPRNADVGEEAMVLAVKRGFEQAQAKANKPSSPSQNDDKEVNRYE